MLTGKIKTVETEGYAWIIPFKPKEKGFGHITFSEEAFAKFYEGESGKDFYAARDSKNGIKNIKKYFKGKNVGISLENY
jgi:hypothetical protein